MDSFRETTEVGAQLSSRFRRYFQESRGRTRSSISLEVLSNVHIPKRDRTFVYAVGRSSEVYWRRGRLSNSPRELSRTRSL